MSPARICEIEGFLDPLGIELKLLDENERVIWPDTQVNDFLWHKSSQVEIEPVGRNEYEARFRIKR